MKSFKRPSARDRQGLTALVLGHPILSGIMKAWLQLALPDCWLSGSAIAQARWNEAFGLPATHGIADVDLVYFDASDLSEEAENEHAARIARIFPDMPVRIDLKNQARVHLWYEARFGYAIEPYRPLYIIRTQIHGSGLMSSGMRPSASRSRLSDQI